MRNAIDLPHDEIHVIGVLAEDAHFGLAPGGTSAVLSFQIRPSRGLPYIVRQVTGNDVTAQEAARRKAQLLKKNVRVTVYAKGLRFQSDHDVAGLRLLDVTDVIPAINPSHCEVNHHQEA